jgi:hypothetical protein
MRMHRQIASFFQLGRGVWRGRGVRRSMQATAANSRPMEEGVCATYMVVSPASKLSV